MYWSSFYTMMKVSNDLNLMPRIDIEKIMVYALVVEATVKTLLLTSVLLILLRSKL